MHWVRNIPCSYFTGKESGTQGDLMARPGCLAGKSGRQDSNPRPADPKALLLVHPVVQLLIPYSSEEGTLWRRCPRKGLGKGSGAMLRRSGPEVPRFLSPTPTLGTLQGHFACSILTNTETEPESALAPGSALLWSDRPPSPTSTHAAQTRIWLISSGRLCRTVIPFTSRSSSPTCTRPRRHRGCPTSTGRGLSPRAPEEPATHGADSSGRVRGQLSPTVCRVPHSASQPQSHPGKSLVYQ